MSFLELEGKTFLVTGLANKKSVAWHIARTLQAEGARVVYSVRSQARKEAVAPLTKEAPVFVCDFEKEGDIPALAQAVSDYAPFDGLVH